MLDSCVNQGAGLQSLGAPMSPRLVVMASHEDQPSELPLLWQLCRAWSALGYPVIVLDATQTESANQPGLQQLLDAQGRSQEGPGEVQDTEWAIYPAAAGLRQLCEGAPRPGDAATLTALTQLFPRYDVVLLYVNAATLATSLPDSGIEPLLAVCPNERSVLTAYQALKLLLINGRLQPTIVSMLASNDTEQHANGAGPNKSLQGCAMSFLGRQITTLTVDLQASDDQVAPDIDRLALRLLECGVAPPASATAVAWQQRLSDNVSGKRSH